MHYFANHPPLFSPAILADGVVKPVWHFMGAFHPAIVHFPIALLTVAALMEGIAVVRARSVKSAPMNPTAFACLLLGAAGAVAAATLGWANASADGGTVGDDTPIVSIHRWAGLALALLAVLTVVVSLVARRRQAAVPVLLYRGGVFAAAALVGLVGLYGGKITHGDDHYDVAFKTLMDELHGKSPENASHAAAATQPAPAPTTQPFDAAPPLTPPARVTMETTTHATREATTPPPPSTPPHEVTATTAPSAAPSQTATSAVAATPPDPTLPRVEYTRDVKPIFDSNCVRCHGAEKQKSSYRLDSLAAAMNPGESGERPIVPGHAVDSLLVKLVEAHGEFANKRMPTKGPPLTGDQVALIKRWVDDGAK